MVASGGNWRADARRLLRRRLDSGERRHGLGFGGADSRVSANFDSVWLSTSGDNSD